MNEKKYKEALHCLELMSHPYEDPDVLITLKEDLDIEVSDDPDEFTGTTTLCTKVTEPYSDELHEEWKGRVKMSPFWRSSDFEVFNKSGKKYIKYSACKHTGEVGGAIAEDYAEKCDLKDEDLTEDQWMKLTEETTYREAERGVTRELIGVELAKKHGIDW